MCLQSLKALLDNKRVFHCFSSSFPPRQTTIDVQSFHRCAVLQSYVQESNGSNYFQSPGVHLPLYRGTAGGFTVQPSQIISQTRAFCCMRPAGPLLVLSTFVNLHFIYFSLTGLPSNNIMFGVGHNFSCA